MSKESSYDYLHSLDIIKKLDEQDNAKILTSPEELPERSAAQIAQANKDLQDAKKKADKKKAIAKIAPGVEVGNISVDDSVLENHGMEAITNDKKEENKENDGR